MTLSNVLHDGAGPVILGYLALTSLVLIAAPAERRATSARTALFVGCLATLVVGRLLVAGGHPISADLIRGLALIVEGFCVVWLVATVLFRVVLVRLGIVQPRILQDVLVAAATGVWAIIVLRVHGLDLTSILATSAVVTAVIGLSLQDTLGNILGGMAIQFEQSIAVGDWIKADDQVGRVVEVRWRYTAIETRNWETVIFPNSVLVKNKFLVLGRRQGQPMQWRRWVWFEVDYRFDPARVVETATRAVRSAAIAHVARTPEPNCVVMDFAGSVGRYAVRYCLTDLSADDATDSDVRTHVYAALKRAGIPLSIPAQAVFLTKETPKRKAQKADEALARRAEAIGHVDLFHDLTPEERQHLAERLVPAPFARDDVMTRQGDQDDGLYIIVAGTAEAVVEDGHGHSRTVSVLGPGGFFGEMGLMTGEPRRATIVARTPVECYRLDRAAFLDIVRSRPPIAEDIAHILAHRRMEYDSALRNLDTQARAEHLSASRHDILGKIRQFFGLDDGN
jgi:small-conductance mechanosensitive channel